MNRIFIEAESFKNKGGWVIDTASMETIHSTYLMAHGMGEPVADAVTELDISEGGKYFVWALTRDWGAVWNLPDPVGKFKLLIDDTPLKNILGTNGAGWAWQLAGEVELEKGNHRIALRDLTGFNGRCDAIYLTDSKYVPSSRIEDIDEMRRSLNWKEVECDGECFDLVVIGGGVAGICAALSAMRSGVSVALINDREILGGCNSSEVRVCMGGEINLPPYKNLGNVVRSIAPISCYPAMYDKEIFEDDRKRLAFEVREGKRAKYKIFYGKFVSDIERDGKKITAVITTDTKTGKKTKILGKLFCDASGDGIVARRAGCEVMYGRDAESEFGESLAPREHENLVMGQSIKWYSEETDSPAPFPDIDWGLKFTDDTCLNCVVGDWEQETGFRRDMVTETEYIRDYGLRAIFANWAYQKHHFVDKEKYKNRALKWVSAIGGKREGYRVKGDHILTQNDIEDRICHEDATACITWSIDMHFPEPTNEEAFGEAFRSFAYHRGIVEPYPVPYRCLYAKDADNLFIGGRIVSMSHIALSAARVMRTLGELGEVVGIASAVCKNHDCTPREVYTDHLDELKALLEVGVYIPDCFGCGTYNDESYHFKDIGWWWLHTSRAQNPDEIEKFKRGVEYLGLKHKYPMPTNWEIG